MDSLEFCRELQRCSFSFCSWDQTLCYLSPHRSVKLPLRPKWHRRAEGRYGLVPFAVSMHESNIVQDSDWLRALRRKFPQGKPSQIQMLQVPLDDRHSR